ncbi:MAG TPA: hypothetical protein VFT51_08835 [Bacillales bacterium]|nr:hypothetical protein [Bacillales bacterium]
MALDLGAKPCLLLSLQPEPYNQIRQGVKKYEYRRKFINEPSLAFVYVSSPIKAVSALVEFGRPVIDSPEYIAEIAEKEKTGSFEGTMRYLEGLEKGYAIPILSFKEIQPVSLDDLRDKFQFTAPQSYFYLYRKPELFTFLKLKARNVNREEE